MKITHHVTGHHKLKARFGFACLYHRVGTDFVDATPEVRVVMSTLVLLPLFHFQCLKRKEKSVIPSMTFLPKLYIPELIMKKHPSKSKSRERSQIYRGQGKTEKVTLAWQLNAICDSELYLLALRMQGRTEGKGRNLAEGEGRPQCQLNCIKKKFF